MVRQKLFIFLKKQISRVLQNKTDLIIVSVFLIMIIFCVINNAVIQKDEPETPQDRLEVAGIHSGSLAAVSKGSAEADISEAEDTDIPDTAAVEEIPEENNKTDELTEESEEEEECIIVGEAIMMEEDNMDEDISLDYKDNNPVPEEDQDIDFSNSDDFRIEVDLGRQKVFVYYKEKIIREMICSGGAESSPTPTGEFKTSQKIEYDWVDRFDMGAYYWIRFYETYLFHSIPFDKDGNMMMEEYEKLGNPASHGCIRLKLEEAKWLYENLPLDVRVLIYKEK